jgi:hypothetical protein
VRDKHQTGDAAFASNGRAFGWGMACMLEALLEVNIAATSGSSSIAAIKKLSTKKSG